MPHYVRYAKPLEEIFNEWFSGDEDFWNIQRIFS